MVPFIKQSLLYIGFTLLTLAQGAHGAPGMNDQQMQQMMMQAQECFSKLDQSKFKELEARGKQMEADIKALCKAGKRDQAMNTAMKYGKEMQDDPQLKALRECGKKLEGMMASMPQPYTPPIDEEGEKGGHVCDDM